MSYVVAKEPGASFARPPATCWPHGMDVDLVFVYGSLKRGFYNHHLLAEAEFIGPACTEPRYRLIDCGPHPAMIETTIDPLAIVGETYHIDAPVLARLDRLEDEGTMYRRVVIDVLTLDGPACDQSVRKLPVMTYLWLGRPDAFSLWPDAVWNKK